MRHFNLHWLGFLMLLLLIVSMACSSAAPTAAPAPTSTPAPPTASPTATTPPTSTPRPTATPNLAATQEIEADQATLQKYLDSGYISSTQGKFYELTDNTREMAQRNYLDYDLAGYKDTVQDFVSWADVNWTSAGPVNYPEFSGCGFGFRMQDNGDAYTAMVTNDAVLVTWCFQALGNRCGRVGKTRGTGTLKLGNPAQAHFSLILDGGHMYALVDEQLIAEYTLFEDRLTDPGYFLYSIVSGTNKDYGTRCTITNGKLWVPEG